MNEKEAKEAAKQLGLGDDIPMIDMNSETFNEEFDFLIQSQHSSSDYRNDRERPYNGQSHTDQGERGKQLVSGLTMRDLKDCLIKAMLESAPSDKYLDPDVFLKCWDFTTDPPTPTQFLLSMQNDSDFVSTKVETGNWRPQDVYKINLGNIDPLAIANNFTCQVEKMMGIFPNIPKSEQDVQGFSE